MSKFDLSKRCITAYKLRAASLKFPVLKVFRQKRLLYFPDHEKIKIRFFYFDVYTL
jgi:hypothetical protein